jgi:hypothetical protein
MFGEAAAAAIVCTSRRERQGGRAGGGGMGAMVDVVAELRQRLERRRMRPSLDVLEDRLRRACLDGSGHLLVTGSDRTEIHAILARVLAAVQPLSAIRTLAADADPNATVDRVITAFDPDATPDNYLDRRAALVELLARAAQAGKSIFVVVDDADRATVEQLERLRASLEIAPEALERLRLVLIGDVALLHKLEQPGARALRTRITASVSMDNATDVATSTTPSRKTTTSYALIFAAAATVAFCSAVYTTYLVGLVTGGDKSVRVAHTPTTDAAPPSRAAMYALRGDEPYLTASLRIDAVSALRKTIIAPPRRALAVKPMVPSKAPEAAPSSGSSIDAFMKRFPAGR